MDSQAPNNELNNENRGHFNPGLNHSLGAPVHRLMYNQYPVGYPGMHHHPMDMMMSQNPPPVYTPIAPDINPGIPGVHNGQIRPFPLATMANINGEEAGEFVVDGTQNMPRDAQVDTGPKEATENGHNGGKKKGNKKGEKDTPSEVKTAGKKRGRPAGSKNTKKGKKDVSDDEIDILPEEDRKKADIQGTKATQAANPRWTPEEANKVIDWITSPEVWPTWKDKQAANFVKISEDTLKEKRTPLQVRSWWNRTWAAYLKAKTALKHTGGGDGDEDDEGKDEDEDDAEEEETKQDELDKGKNKKNPPRRDFAKTYIFQQLDKVAYDHPSVVRTHLYSSSAPPTEAEEGDATEDEEDRPKKKPKRSDAEAIAAADLNEPMKDVAERGKARLRLEQEKLEMEKAKEEREIKREEILEGRRKVEGQRQALMDRQKVIIEMQRGLLDAMRADDDDIKTGAKKAYKNLTQELEEIGEKLRLIDV